MATENLNNNILKVESYFNISSTSWTKVCKYYNGRVKTGTVGGDSTIAYSNEFEFITIPIDYLKGIFLEFPYDPRDGGDATSFIHLIEKTSDEEPILTDSNTEESDGYLIYRKRADSQNLSNYNSWYYSYKGGVVIDFRQAANVVNDGHKVTHIRFCRYIKGQTDSQRTALYVIRNNDDFEKQIFDNNIYKNWTKTPYLNIATTTPQIVLPDKYITKNENNILANFESNGDDITSFSSGAYLTYNDAEVKFHIRDDVSIEIVEVILGKYDDNYKNFRIIQGMNSDYKNNQIQKGKLKDNILVDENIVSVLNDTKLRVINHLEAGRYLTFAVMPDIKARETDYEWENNFELFNRFMEVCDFGTVLGNTVYGGTGLNSNTQQEKADFVSNAGLVTEKIGRIKKPVLMVHGKSDCNADVEYNTNSFINNNQWNIIFSVEKTAGEISSGGIGKNYYYKDFDEYSIRVIVLNKWVSNSSVTEGYGQEQLIWLADNALDFGDKNNISDWSVIILQNGHNIEEVRNILVAFRSAGSVTINNVTYNFATKNNNTTIPIVAVINGNNIEDVYDYDNPDGGNNQPKSTYINNIGLNKGYIDLGNGLESWRIGTKEEFLMSVFVIDTVENRLYELRAGMGEDRTWSYGIQTSENDDPINCEILD